MSHRDSFIAALDADPSDQVTRSIFADWLEENGDGASDLILAKGLRWMEENNKWPSNDTRGNYDWWLLGIDHCRVEFKLIGSNKVLRSHKSRHAAEVALAEALWNAGITK